MRARNHYQLGSDLGKSKISSGRTEANGGSTSAMLGVYYEDLRRLARSRLRGEFNGSSILATDLVHEVFLKIEKNSPSAWENSRHFFGAFLMAMREVLIDRHRRKKAQKRGGGQWQRENLESAKHVHAPAEGRWERAESACARLFDLDPRTAKIAELRLARNLSIRDTADAMGISESSVKREWRFVRAWLAAEVQSEVDCG